MIFYNFLAKNLLFQAKAPSKSNKLAGFPAKNDFLSFWAVFDPNNMPAIAFVADNIPNILEDNGENRRRKTQPVSNPSQIAKRQSVSAFSHPCFLLMSPKNHHYSSIGSHGRQPRSAAMATKRFHRALPQGKHPRKGPAFQPPLPTSPSAASAMFPAVKPYFSKSRPAGPDAPKQSIVT